MSDPIAQGKLIADLQATDPSLWPLVIQQFRSAVAYRRNVQIQEATSNPEYYPPTDGPLSKTAQLVPTNPAFGGLARQQQLTITDQPPPLHKPQQHSVGKFKHLPIPDETVLPPTKAPRHQYPDTSQPTPRRNVANGLSTARSSDRSGEVVAASLTEETGENWRTLLSATIESLEKSVDHSPQTADKVAEHARLRLLYLVANRRNDLIEPIPETTLSVQNFWAKELQGLSTWLDTKRTPEDRARAAQAKHELSGAINSLSELAPLSAENIAFCTEVQSFGAIKRFKKNEFIPGQEVLIYAEIENFTSQRKPNGYHTSLRSNYQIFDNRNQCVDKHDFSIIEETSKQPRRDFFIGYHIYLPKQIQPGKHSLQLTIEDVKSQKIAKTSIDFIVKSTKK